MKVVGALRVILLAAFAGYVQSTGAVLKQSLSTFRDLVYAAPFGMGIPTQKFQLIIDHASSTLRVAEECCVDCCHMNWYNPNKSTSFQGGNSGSWVSCSLGGAGQAGECYGFTEAIQVRTDLLTMRAVRIPAKVPANLKLSANLCDYTRKKRFAPKFTSGSGLGLATQKSEDIR